MNQREGSDWNVYYDQEADLIIFEAWGVGDAIIASEASEMVLELYEQHPVPILVDASGSVTVTGRASKIYAESLKNIFHKVAVVSDVAVVRTTARVIFKTAGRSDQFKIFATIEKAKEWLSE